MTTPINRYPGARPFGDSALDRAMFFGREEESRALLHQLLAVNLLVFFGKSGLGKTSLVSAGLYPALRQRDFLPLPVRFNHSDPALTPVAVIHDAITRTCAAENIDFTPGTGDSLWEFFKTSVFWRGDRLQTPVLVLDQFEELFTLQNETFRRAAAAQLGQLSGQLMPRHLRERVKKGEILPYSDKPPQLKILLSLREDYLGALQELSADIPAILQNRFRLTGLSLDGARSAVTEPALLALDGVTFAAQPFKYIPATVEEIIATARDEDGTVEPFFLQILCSHVERQVRQKQAAGGPNSPIEVDGSYLGGKEGVKALTGRFYLGALARIPEAGMRRHARRMCEEGLLTGGGRRRSALQEDLQQQFGVNAGVLGVLENERLLRKEPRHGSFYYEISHDRLAAAVQENRLWKVPRELKIAIAAFATLLVIALVTMGVYARFQANKSREAAELAKLYNLLLDGDAYESGGRWSYARELFSKALDGWKQRAKDDPKESQWLKNQAETQERIADTSFKIAFHAIAQEEKGQSRAADQAQKDYRSAAEIWDTLAKQHPGNPEWQRKLAGNHDQCANLLKDLYPNRALEELGKALEIRKTLARNDGKARDDQTDLALTHDTIGDLQRAQDTKESVDNALVSYGEALKVRRNLSLACPKDDALLHDLAASYDRRGLLMDQLHRPEEALKDFDESLKILQELSARQQKNPIWQRELSVGYNRVADIKQGNNDPQGALELYEKALKIRTALASDDKLNMDLKRDLAVSHANIGDVLTGLKDTKKALSEQRESLRLSKEVAAQNPQNVDDQISVAQSLESVAPLLMQMEGGGAKSKTIEHAQEALKLLRELDRRAGVTPLQKSEITDLIKNAGKFLGALGAEIPPDPAK